MAGVSPLPDKVQSEHEVSPKPILEIASGFLAAKHLFIANEVGLFDALTTHGPATLAALSDRLHLPARTLRIVTDAMVALGILVQSEGTYSHSPVSQAFLSGQGPGDLRPFLRFWNRLSYPNWLNYEQAIRGEPGIHKQKEWTEEEGRIFSEGVEAITAETAQALAMTYDFNSHQRVLDVGGGTGSFLGALLRQHPHLQPTLFEIPSVLAVAQNRLLTTPYHDKINLVAGDFFHDPLPDGHDAVLVANVIHLLSPDHNRQLLTKIRQAVPSKARLLLVDFWTDSTHTAPPFAALMAGEFLLVSREGDVYSVDEVKTWLEETQWQMVEHRPLSGASTLIVGKTV